MSKKLRDILTWVFRPLTERHRGNLRLVAGCLLLSSVIWLLNSLNGNIDTELSVPLNVKYNEKQYMPLRPIPKNIVAHIRGYGWQVLRFFSFEQPEPVHVWMKHPGLHSSFDTTLFREHLDSTLEYIDVSHVMIDSINMPFDRKSHKWVHMRVGSDEHSQKGNQSILLHPDKILVSGPNTMVSKMLDTIHVPIAIHSADKDFNRNIKVVHLLNNQSLKASHEQINVKFKASKQSVSQ